jgi:hypothetical protein
MEQQDNLRQQFGQLEDRLATATKQEYVQLQPEYEAIKARLAEMGSAIEERGGVAVSQKDFAKQIAAEDKKFQDFQQKGETDKATEQANKVLEMEKRLALFEEMRVAQEQRGQTGELFTQEQAPVPVAKTEEEALAVEQPPTAAPTEVVREEKAATPESTAAAEKAYAEIQDLEKQVARLRGREIPENADKIAKLNQLKADYAAATKPTLLDKNTLDLFSEQNIINTAIQSGDQATLERVANAQIEKERQTKRSVAEEDRATKERLIQALDKRLNLAGTEVRRTVTPEQYDATMEEIKTLHNRVVKAQGNASKSYLQQLYDLANQ